MEEETIDGGWEGDIRVDGGYAVLMGPGEGSYIRTHFGSIAHPVGQPVVRYPRISQNGPFKVSGQTDRIVEWHDGEWRDVTTWPIAATVATVYDKNNRLYIVDRTIHDSASGFLYCAPITNQPMLYEQSVYDPNGLRLHEWIDLGDGWIVGQGHDGGCYMYTPQNNYVQIYAGDAMFIRAVREGNRVGVVFYERPLPVTHLFWFDLDEVWTAFPVLDTLVPEWVDEPEVIVPEFPKANHKVNVQVFGGPGFRMNLGDKHDRDVYAVPSGAFFTLDNDDYAAFKRQEAYAVANDVPMFQYLDKNSNPWTVTEVRPSEAEVVPTVKVYPDKPWKQIEDELDALCEKYDRVAVVVAGYRQMIGYGPEMNWRLEDVLDRARDVWYNICTRKEVKDVLIFHQHRQATHPVTGKTNLDGLGSRAELQEMANGLQKAGDVVEPEPEPEVPVQPEPVQPEPPSYEAPQSTNRPTMTQPEFTRPEPVRVETPIGGSVWWDIWQIITKTNYRKIDFRKLWRW